MLRIFFAEDAGAQRWTLCGQLAGPWVEVLRSCWQKHRRNAVDSREIVDLSDVIFIDGRGERLLSEMEAARVEFLAAGVATKHLIETLKTR